MQIPHFTIGVETSAIEVTGIGDQGDARMKQL